ncbi:PQ-loop repeat [Dillenia turbinata]|uniref:PQ-loop repeat n=1 Tax=Dillenia turbinata TaxID=194707 RepID=A0AAN8W396_9MAGN
MAVFHPSLAASNSILYGHGLNKLYVLQSIIFGILVKSFLLVANKLLCLPSLSLNVKLLSEWGVKPNQNEMFQENKANYDDAGRKLNTHVGGLHSGSNDSEQVNGSSSPIPFATSGLPHSGSCERDLYSIHIYYFDSSLQYFSKIPPLKVNVSNQGSTVTNMRSFLTPYDFQKLGYEMGYDKTANFRSQFGNKDFGGFNPFSYSRSARLLSSRHTPTAGSFLAQRASACKYHDQKNPEEPLLLTVVSQSSASPSKTKTMLITLPTEERLDKFPREENQEKKWDYVSEILLLEPNLIRSQLGTQEEIQTEPYVFDQQHQILVLEKARGGAGEGSSGIGTILGWAMAAIYMGGRLPQICLNGLNPFMFIFALIGNSTYIPSILVNSLDWSKIRPNLPWLVDAADCVLLDTFPEFMDQLLKIMSENKWNDPAKPPSCYLGNFDAAVFGQSCLWPFCTPSSNNHFIDNSHLV